jgi:hypothetical protein
VPLLQPVVLLLLTLPMLMLVHVFICRAAAEAAVDKYVTSNSVVAFGNGELVSSSSVSVCTSPAAHRPPTAVVRRELCHQNIAAADLPSSTESLRMFVNTAHM